MGPTFELIPGPCEVRSSSASGIWEPFAQWVAENYPDDVEIMYVEGSDQGLQRISEESNPLWEQRTREYAESGGTQAADAATLPPTRRFLGERFEEHDGRAASATTMIAATSVELIGFERRPPAC